MKPSPTLAKVAHLAGVSKTTAANVLSGRRKMGAATTQRVMAAAVSIGYRQNAAASGLSRGRPKVIGVLTADHLANMVEEGRSLYWPRFSAAFVQQCSRAGLVVSFASESKAQALIDSGIDLLMVLGTHTDETFAGLRIPYGLPIVTRDNIPGHPILWGTHIPDSIAAAVVTHFKEQQSEHLAWIVRAGLGAMFDPWEDALASQAHRVDMQFSAYNHDGSEVGVRACIDQLIADGADCVFSALAETALLCDSITYGGRSVPNDMLLVVQAEGLIESAMSPTVSSLSLMSLASGAMIADLCIANVAGETTTPAILPFELTIRESSIRG